MSSRKTKSVYDAYGYEEINGETHYGMFHYNAQSKASEFVSYGRYIGISKIAWIKREHL